MPANREGKYKLLYQHVLDKYYNDHPQWEEKARKELADHCIKTGVGPGTQLMRSGPPYRGGACVQCFLHRNDFVEPRSGQRGTGVGICLFEIYRN